MAGRFFSRKSKNGVETTPEPAPLGQELAPIYDAMPGASFDEPPDALPGVPDLYAVLGVDPRASDDIIRYAYRKKAAKLHDARWRAGRAARQLAELNAAYEILGKPDRRADYDRQRARLYYYQQAALQQQALEEGLFKGADEAAGRGKRSRRSWPRLPIPRGLLEAVVILGIVAVAIYAGYTVLGSTDALSLDRVRDAGAALGLPIGARPAPTSAPAPTVGISVTPTPRQVIVPAVPTSTSAPSPTAAPPASAKPAGDTALRSTARMSNPAPARRTEVGVIARITREGRPVEGVPVRIVVHYRTVDEAYPADGSTVATNSNGEATISFNVGDATAGFAANVDVIAVHEGETVQTQTSFTPR